MPISIKQRTSSLGTIVLSFNSLPERQCDGNFDFLQIFQPIKAQVYWYIQDVTVFQMQWYEIKDMEIC